MATNSRIRYGYINIVDPARHQGQLTRDNVERYTDGFAKPALFRGLANIGAELSERAFYDKVGSDKSLQWRVKTGNQPVSMRSEQGESDYNYVTGKVGTGQEFLDDIFVRKLDVYSHLGTIASGYNEDIRKIAFAEGQGENEELAHFLTSINYASRHINRAQMILNDVEYAYLRKRGDVGAIHIGHQ
ncbi:hypothetical protein [Pseudomonas brenneri]